MIIISYFLFQHRITNLLVKGTLRDPWDTLIFLDRKVKHVALPFEPAISDLPCHQSIMLHAVRQKYTDDIKEKVESMATMTNAAKSDSE